MQSAMIMQALMCSGHSVIQQILTTNSEPGTELRIGVTAMSKTDKITALDSLMF